MLFHRLFPAAVFSLTLALTGCGGMDDTLSPHIKPDGGSNNGGNTGGSNNGGNTGGSNNGGNTGGSNNGGSNGGSNNGGSDNGGGDNSTNPPVANCPLPDNSYSLATLGNTGDNSTYDLSTFSKVSAASSLAGTWVLIATSSVATPAQSSSSAQKYIFVIQDSGSDYKVANCAGQIQSTKTYTCVDRGGTLMSCDDEGAVRLEPPIISYQPWQGLIDAKVENKDGKQIIRLPLFDGDILAPSHGIELALVGTEFNELKSADGLYQALKISANTNALGSSQAPTNSAGSPVWCSVQVKAHSHSCTNNSDIRLLSVFATTNIEQHRLLTGDGMNGLQITRIYADSDSEDGRNSSDYAGSISTQSITTDALQVQINLSIDQKSITLNVDAN